MPHLSWSNVQRQRTVSFRWVSGKLYGIFNRIMLAIPQFTNKTEIYGLFDIFYIADIPISSYQE